MSATALPFSSIRVSDAYTRASSRNCAPLPATTGSQWVGKYEEAHVSAAGAAAPELADAPPKPQAASAGRRAATRTVPRVARRLRRVRKAAISGFLGEEAGCRAGQAAGAPRRADAAGRRQWPTAQGGPGEALRWAPTARRRRGCGTPLGRCHRLTASRAVAGGGGLEGQPVQQARQQRAAHRPGPTERHVDHGAARVTMSTILAGCCATVQRRNEMGSISRRYGTYNHVMRNNRTLDIAPLRSFVA